MKPKTDPVTLTVTWKGGSEDWWMVQARGRRWLFPGHRQLTDVLQDILDGDPRHQVPVTRSE